jgi:multiple sugar transport system substrate-binding protein
MLKQRWKTLAAALVIALVAVSCGGAGGGTTDTTVPPAGDDGATTTSQAPSDDGGSSGDRVQVRWFVGLGAGGQPEQITAQEKVVAEFNAAQDEIELVLEIVENEVAYDTLATQVAAGNAPDIIGPVGRDGSNSFAGLYLDLEPLIESTGFDTSRWPQATIDNFREPDGTLPGLPFASFPSFIYFNKELFDEAGLPYPPQEYGPDGLATYGEGTEWEGTWDFDKVAEIARYLSVDANGNDGTSSAFDREQTVQWGFVWQWTDRLFQQGSFWGAGYPYQDDGSADIPQAWEDEWRWYHAAVWEHGFAPSQTQLDSELLAGNAFSSGNVAMAGTHLWYTCCVRNDDGTGKDFWDLAVMPSHDGTVTANMHADTFRIMASTKNPEAAFQVLTYLLTDAALDLLNAYGAAPADESLTDAFFASLDEVYPQGVNWQVAQASADFADNPSHEQWLPGWDEYKLRLDDAKSALLSDPNLDLDAEIADIEADLTEIFRANS